MRHVIALLFLITSFNVFGWGTLGHMVVGQVAENNLTPAAKKKLDLILQGDTLAEVSNWADHVKGQSEWAHTKPWHFVDIPDGEDYSTIEHSHDGDIVSAITSMVEVLKKRTSTKTEKLNALKFIVHFMGDIHQPLHVGRPDDRGGNSLKLVFEGRPANLHSLWDTVMIMKQPMDHVEYARYLESASFFHAPYDLPEIAFSKVIHECMDARDEIYDFESNPNGPIILDGRYYNRHLELMNTQLLSGGKRLALLLNTIFK